MPQSRFFEDPTWDEVLKGDASVEEYIKTVAESIWDSFNTLSIPRGEKMNEYIKQRYLIDKKRMRDENLAPEDFQEPCPWEFFSKEPQLPEGERRTDRITWPMVLAEERSLDDYIHFVIDVLFSKRDNYRKFIPDCPAAYADRYEKDMALMRAGNISPENFHEPQVWELFPEYTNAAK